MPSKNGAAIVLAHGSSGTRADLLPEARALTGAGFGVLLFDFPGHGESDGKVTWGEPDRAAFEAAVTFAGAQPDVKDGRVGAFGFSLGSAVALAVAARDPRVKAVVLAGPLTTLEAQLSYENGSWGPVTQLPALWVQRGEGLPVDTMRPIDDVGRPRAAPPAARRGRGRPHVLAGDGQGAPRRGGRAARAVDRAGGGPRRVLHRRARGLAGPRRRVLRAHAASLSLV